MDTYDALHQASLALDKCEPKTEFERNSLEIAKTTITGLQHALIGKEEIPDYQPETTDGLTKLTVMIPDQTAKDLRAYAETQPMIAGKPLMFAVAFVIGHFLKQMGYLNPWQGSGDT